jgi:hypothetical protein
MTRDKFWEFAVSTEKAILAERDDAIKRWSDHNALCGSLLAFATWLEKNRGESARAKVITLLRCVAPRGPGRTFEPVQVCTIAEWCGVGRGAATNALADLRRRGLVIKAPGKGNQGGYWASEPQNEEGAEA